LNGSGQTIRNGATGPSATKLNFALCPSFAGNTTVSGSMEGASNYRANAGFSSGGSNAVGGGGTVPLTASNTAGLGGFSFTQRLGFRDFSDGTSKTVQVSESRADPDTIQSFPCRWILGELFHMPSHACGTLSSAGVWDGTDTRLILMSGSNTTTNPPAQSAVTVSGSAINLRWGPSSDHAGKIIGHLFADGHVEFIGADIDAGTYHALNTRSSGEPIKEY